jgi:hypothetical protein
LRRLPRRYVYEWVAGEYLETRGVVKTLVPAPGPPEAIRESISSSPEVVAVLGSPANATRAANQEELDQWFDDYFDDRLVPRLHPLKRRSFLDELVLLTVALSGPSWISGRRGAP